MEVQPDFRKLLALFNAHSVEYMIVGGYALAFHGAPRFNGDLDIFVRPNMQNARRILAVLDEFGFGSQGLSPIAMISGPLGLRLIKGFHDESLRGERQGYRSSRLGLQYRVIYRVIPEKAVFQVLHVTPRDYRRLGDEDISSGGKAARRVRGKIGSHHSRIAGVQPE